MYWYCPSETMFNTTIAEPFSASSRDFASGRLTLVRSTSCTVVTMKKMISRNAMSAIDAVGITASAFLVTRVAFIPGSQAFRAEPLMRSISSKVSNRMFAAVSISRV